MTRLFTQLYHFHMPYSLTLNFTDKLIRTCIQRIKSDTRISSIFHKSLHLFIYLQPLRNTLYTSTIDRNLNYTFLSDGFYKGF